VALVSGVAIGIGVTKVKEYFAQKEAISTAEVDEAKKEIIQGIRDYDAKNEMPQETDDVDRL